MKQNLKPIAPKRNHSVVQNLGEVLEANNGEALTVLVDGSDTEQQSNVIAHASEVPPLQTGDRVVILETEEGAIITHRLRNPGERPSAGFMVNTDGSLSVKTAEGLTLATDHATIELRADGVIFFDGEEIYSESRGLQSVLGRPLKLN